MGNIESVSKKKKKKRKERKKAEKERKKDWGWSEFILPFQAFRVPGPLGVLEEERFRELFEMVFECQGGP
jgi:hypothetical protein